MRNLRRYGCTPMDDERPKRPKTTKGNSARKVKEHVAVRLEPDVVAEIDAVVLDLSSGWRQANRSDALRMLLLKGLKVHKAEKAATQKGDPGPTT
jgi:hypothetical protein